MNQSPACAPCPGSWNRPLSHPVKHVRWKPGPAHSLLPARGKAAARGLAAHTPGRPLPLRNRSLPDGTAASASGLVPGSAAQGTPDGGPVGLPRASKPHTGCDAPDSSSGSGWFGRAWGVAQGGLCSNYRQRPGSGGEDREKWQALSLGWSPTEHGEQLTVRSSRVRSGLGNKLSSAHAIRGRCLRTYSPGLRRGPSGTGATAA